MDEPQKHHTKWKKVDSRQSIMDCVNPLGKMGRRDKSVKTERIAGMAQLGI